MSHPFQDIYDKVPKIECRGHCGRDRHNTPCTVIGCTAVEAHLLEQYDGIEAPWRSLEHGMLRMDPPDRIGWVCPHLSRGGQCDAYEVRPMVCRLWGVVETMPCTWGCKPERYLTHTQGLKLLIECEARANLIYQKAIRGDHD